MSERSLPAEALPADPDPRWAHPLPPPNDADPQVVVVPTMPLALVLLPDALRARVLRDDVPLEGLAVDLYAPRKILICPTLSLARALSRSRSLCARLSTGTSVSHGHAVVLLAMRRLFARCRAAGLETSWLVRSLPPDASSARPAYLCAHRPWLSPRAIAGLLTPSLAPARSLSLLPPARAPRLIHSPHPASDILKHGSTALRIALLAWILAVRICEATVLALTWHDEDERANRCFDNYQTFLIIHMATESVYWALRVFAAFCIHSAAPSVGHRVSAGELLRFALLGIFQIFRIFFFGVFGFYLMLARQECANDDTLLLARFNLALIVMHAVIWTFDFFACYLPQVYVQDREYQRRAAHRRQIAALREQQANLTGEEVTAHLSVKELGATLLDDLTARESATCVICLDDFGLKDELCRLRCGHHFHKQCVSQWFDRNAVCPLCKLPALSPGTPLPEIRGGPAHQARAAAALYPAATPPPEGN